MSAKHAVLGLVIERPGHGYQLARRLDERFGSSAFAPSCVYSALDQLTRDRLVRKAHPSEARAARRGGRRTVYEATARGVAEFRAWMHGPSPAPPLRDDLQMKIALCRPRDLPRLIDMLYGQELACRGRMRELHRDPQARANVEPHADWTLAMRTLGRDTETACWRARIEWLQSTRKLLEELLEQTRRAPPGGDPPAERPTVGVRGYPAG
ncbi:MAG TPA: helix-turn-helix transcriptional regulator [Solirubrobacteraceae bacterium]|jgi:DNA-binding PadR family transcriptional regulator|nr:helix-turn-helix transcriptional regulator [Solirubrobacteraceae bacterium]